MREQAGRGRGDEAGPEGDRVRRAEEVGAHARAGARLGPDGLELAGTIVDDIKLQAAEAARQPKSQDAQAAGRRAGPAEVEFEPPSDFLVVVHDKYEFRIPVSGFFFNENDVWAQVAGNRARVGISDYMQQRLTDITYVDPPEIGTAIEQFGEVGSVESTKANFELVSPVSGTVVRVNEAVTTSPSRSTKTPTAAGSWSWS